MKDRNKLIGIIFAVVIIVVVLNAYFIPRIAKEVSPKEAIFSGKSNFVIPEVVSLTMLQDINEGEDVLPNLQLSVAAGSGCDEVSDLKIKNNFQPENNLIEVNIDGYDFKKYKGGNTCVAITKEANAKINIADILRKTKESQLIFSLAGERNSYSLKQDSHAIYLKPEDVTNVISHSFASNIPKKAETIVILSKSDELFRISLYGTSYLDTNYNAKLREFARAKGLVPVEEVFQGFTNSERDSLFVVSTIPVSSEKEPNILGNIEAKSAHGFDHIVGVQIRKENLPFNMYSY